MVRNLMTWEEVGARLAQARRAAGLTQADLAKRVGLDRTAITKIEQGQRGIDSLELGKVAVVLARPVDWFVVQSPPAVVSRRNQLDVSGERREDFELELWARDVQLLVDLGVLELNDPPRPGFAIDSVSAAESAAGFVREALALPLEPVADLTVVTDRLGLMVACIQLADEQLDGSYIALDRGGVAVINGGAQSGRRRFTVAHEIGHHILADSYSAEWLVADGNEEREKLINAFAINLLAPRPVVLSLWHRQPTTDRRRAAIELGVELGLSWTALCAQLRNLGLIDEAERSLLVVEKPTRVDYLELGISVHEDLRPPSVSRQFGAAAIKAYRQAKLTAARTVALLRGTIDEADLPPRKAVPLDAMQRELAPLGEE